MKAVHQLVTMLAVSVFGDLKTSVLREDGPRDGKGLVAFSPHNNNFQAKKDARGRAIRKDPKIKIAEDKQKAAAVERDAKPSFEKKARTIDAHRNEIDHEDKEYAPTVHKDGEMVHNDGNYEFRNGHAYDGAQKIKEETVFRVLKTVEEPFLGGDWFDPSGGHWGEDGDNSPTNTDAGDVGNNDLRINQQELAKFDPHGTLKVFADLNEEESFVKSNTKQNRAQKDSFEIERTKYLKQVKKKLATGIERCIVQTERMLKCTIEEERVWGKDPHNVGKCPPTKARAAECAACLFLEDVTYEMGVDSKKDIDVTLTLKGKCPGHIKNLRDCVEKSKDPDCKRNKHYVPDWTPWQETHYLGQTCFEENTGCKFIKKEQGKHIQAVAGMCEKQDDTFTCKDSCAAEGASDSTLCFYSKPDNGKGETSLDPVESVCEQNKERTSWKCKEAKPATLAQTAGKFAKTYAQTMGKNAKAAALTAGKNLHTATKQSVKKVGGYASQSVKNVGGYASQSVKNVGGYAFSKVPRFRN